MAEKTVAILASHTLHPNMEAVLYNLGRMCKQEFDMHLIVGPEDVPSHLKDLYTVADIECHKHCPPKQNAYGKLATLGFPFIAAHKYLARYQPSVLMNVGQTFPLGLAVVLLGNWHGVPTILRVTDDYFTASNFGSLWKRCARSLMHEYAFSSVYKSADIVLPVGSNLASNLVATGFGKNQVCVLSQPFDPRPFSPVQDAIGQQMKRSMGLEVDKEIILYVGRINRRKGADRVFKIADAVCGESDAYQFCLVGEGEYVTDFRERFAAEDVHCAGMVPRSQVGKFFKVADMLIHPTRRDALPNVILEALAAGVPVMAAPVGEIANLVTMLSHDPKDYVDKILEGDWVNDPLPTHFGWNEQKRRYTRMFKEVAD